MDKFSEKNALYVITTYEQTPYFRTQIFFFMSQERSTLVATLTCVQRLSRIPLPDDEEFYGVHQYQNCAKPLYFPTNSVCQCNTDSKMCWHDPELLRTYLFLPDYDALLTHIQKYSTHFLQCDRDS